MSTYRSTRPRRSRFTVTLEGHPRRVILAYDTAGVHDYYTKRGYTVLRIDSGDYRQKVAVRSGGFRINQRALKDAIDLLGIKNPVRVRFNARYGGTHGNHRYEPSLIHNIMLKSYLTADEASSTLWHELTHAMQAERAGSYADWGQYRATQKRQTPKGDYRRQAYLEQPIEVEAREMSETMKDIKLCY